MRTMRAGFTVASAARYYATAAAHVGAAVPPGDLRQSILPTWLEGAAAVGLDTSFNPLSLKARKPTFVAYNPVAANSRGMRRDACTAYLEPVRRGVCRGNLEVVQSAVVSKIEVEEGRATGVTYLCAPIRFRLAAPTWHTCKTCSKPCKTLQEHTSEMSCPRDRSVGNASCCLLAPNCCVLQCCVMFQAAPDGSGSPSPGTVARCTVLGRHDAMLALQIWKLCQQIRSLPLYIGPDDAALVRCMARPGG